MQKLLLLLRQTHFSLAANVLCAGSEQFVLDMNNLVLEMNALALEMKALNMCV